MALLALTAFGSSAQTRFQDPCTDLVIPHVHPLAYQDAIALCGYEEEAVLTAEVVSIKREVSPVLEYDSLSSTVQFESFSGGCHVIVVQVTTHHELYTSSEFIKYKIAIKGSAAVRVPVPHQSEGRVCHISLIRPEGRIDGASIGKWGRRITTD